MYMYNRLWIFISQINDSIRPRTVIVTVALLSGTLFFFLIWTVIGICQMFNRPFSYLRVVGKIWTVTESCKFVLLSITLLSFCKHYFHGPDIKNFTMINISGINYMKKKHSFCILQWCIKLKWTQLNRMLVSNFF